MNFVSFPASGLIAFCSIAADTFAGDAALDVVADSGINADFRELPNKLIEEAEWSGVHAARWRPTGAHITALEMYTRTFVHKSLTR